MKMSKKLIYLGILVLVGLLVVNKFKVKQSNKEVRLFDVKSDQISKIEIKPTGGEESFSLESRDGNWFSLDNAGEELVLDSEQVSQAIEVLQKVSLNDKVSQSVERQADLGLTEELALSLKVYGLKDQELLSLLVGQSASVLNSTYFRLAGQADIYLAKVNLAASFPAQLISWRQKKLFVFDRDQVTGLEINSVAKGLISLNRVSEGIWQDSQEVKVDFNKVNGYFNVLANLTLNSFLTAEEKTDKQFEEKDASLTVSLAMGDDQSIAVSFGPEVEGETKVVGFTNNNEWVEINKSELRKAEKEVDYFNIVEEKEKEEVSTDPESVEAEKTP